MPELDRPRAARRARVHSFSSAKSARRKQKRRARAAARRRPRRRRSTPYPPRFRSSISRRPWSVSSGSTSSIRSDPPPKSPARPPVAMTPRACRRSPRRSGRSSRRRARGTRSRGPTGSRPTVVLPTTLLGPLDLDAPQPRGLLEERLGRDRDARARSRRPRTRPGPSRRRRSSRFRNRPRCTVRPAALERRDRIDDPVGADLLGHRRRGSAFPVLTPGSTKSGSRSRICRSAWRSENRSDGTTLATMTRMGASSSGLGPAAKRPRIESAISSAVASRRVVSRQCRDQLVAAPEAEHGVRIADVDREKRHRPAARGYHRATSPAATIVSPAAVLSRRKPGRIEPEVLARELFAVAADRQDVARPMQRGELPGPDLLAPARRARAPGRAGREAPAEAPRARRPFRSRASRVVALGTPSASARPRAR